MPVFPFVPMPLGKGPRIRFCIIIALASLIASRSTLEPKTPSFTCDVVRLDSTRSPMLRDFTGVKWLGMGSLVGAKAQ